MAEGGIPTGHVPKRIKNIRLLQRLFVFNTLQTQTDLRGTAMACDTVRQKIMDLLWQK